MKQTIKIWDRIIRFTNWGFFLSLVAILFTAGSTGAGATIHILTNSILFILLSLRIFWGMVGGQTALFKNMVPPPSELFLQLYDLTTFKQGNNQGHSPIGGLVSFIILALLGMTAITGLQVVNIQGQGSWVASMLNTKPLEGPHVEHITFATLSLALWVTYAGGVVYKLFQENSSILSFILNGEMNIQLSANEPKASLTPQSSTALMGTTALALCVAIMMLVPALSGTNTIRHLQQVDQMADLSVEELADIDTAAGNSLSTLDDAKQNIGLTNVRKITSRTETDTINQAPETDLGGAIDLPIITE